MPAPTIYFPADVDYKIGFRHGRRWSTEETLGPTGRRQARMLWSKPKRSMQATVWATTRRGSDLTISGITPITDEHVFGGVMRVFLDAVGGNFRSFYIFNPKRQYFPAIDCGTITLPGDLPFKLPFRGLYGAGTGAFAFATIQPVNVLSLWFPDLPIGVGTTVLPADFIAADNVTLETTLTAVTPTPALVGTSRLFCNVDNAYERIPARNVTDMDDFQYDFDWAEPPTEIVLDLEEDFG